MADFDPGGFLDTAQSLLPGLRTDADYRTASGRAYYAAYGILRTRLCAAKGKSPKQMFGKAGRHRELADAMAVAGADFKRLARTYNLLRLTRGRSDYEYHEPVKRPDARDAVDDATWIVAQLDQIDERAFRSFPLGPSRRR